MEKTNKTKTKITAEKNYQLENEKRKQKIEHTLFSRIFFLV